MISTENKIRAFGRLGEWLRSQDYNETDISVEVSDAIDAAGQNNPWFTKEFVAYALKSIGESLHEEQLRQWIEPYLLKLSKESLAKNVAVINAGNIPAVGFHDFLCVLISGLHYAGKLSSSDRILMPFLGSQLLRFEPGFKGYFTFTENRLSGFDAVIATGSNNTARYFEYYFGKYPHIIRKNRNGVAVLDGGEDAGSLSRLADDIFLYFGMGCRSIAKLFVLSDYSYENLQNPFEKFRHLSDFHKYRNNYDYYKSTFLINKIAHWDNGFILVTTDTRFSSPPAVIYAETWETFAGLKTRLADCQEDIQCVVGQVEGFDNMIPFGKAQRPDLWDYSDGIDTMKFLNNL